MGGTDPSLDHCTFKEPLLSQTSLRINRPAIVISWHIYTAIIDDDLWRIFPFLFILWKCYDPTANAPLLTKQCVTFRLPVNVY